MQRFRGGLMFKAHRLLYHSAKCHPLKVTPSGDTTPCRMTGVTLHSHVHYTEIYARTCSGPLFSSVKPYSHTRSGCHEESEARIAKVNLLTLSAPPRRVKETVVSVARPTNTSATNRFWRGWTSSTPASRSTGQPTNLNPKP